MTDYKPPTLADLKANPKFKLTRRPEVQKNYEYRLQYIKEVMKVTSEKYIKERVLKNKEGIVLKINNYPYWTDGLYHYVLWNNQTHKISKTFVKKLYKDRLDKIFILENKQANQSVSKIQHFHILSKIKLI